MSYCPTFLRTPFFSCVINEDVLSQLIRDRPTLRPCSTAVSMLCRERGKFEGLGTRLHECMTKRKYRWIVITQSFERLPIVAGSWHANSWSPSQPFLVSSRNGRSVAWRERLRGRLQSRPKVVGTLKPDHLSPIPPNQCWKISRFFQQKEKKITRLSTL